MFSWETGLHLSDSSQESHWVLYNTNISDADITVINRFNVLCAIIYNKLFSVLNLTLITISPCLLVLAFCFI